MNKQIAKVGILVLALVLATAVYTQSAFAAISSSSGSGASEGSLRGANGVNSGGPGTGGVCYQH